MKGLVKFGRGEGNMELRDVPEPITKEGQGKIEVKASGTCGSDSLKRSRAQRLY